jgi:hypothetical protein
MYCTLYVFHGNKQMDVSNSVVAAQLLANINWQTYRFGGAFTITFCHYIILEQVAYTM